MHPGVCFHLRGFELLHDSVSGNVAELSFESVNSHYYLTGRLLASGLDARVACRRGHFRREELPYCVHTWGNCPTAAHFAK